MRSPSMRTTAAWPAGAALLGCCEAPPPEPVRRVRSMVVGDAPTVLGAAPLRHGVFWLSMSVTIMAGLSFGTILTMVLVPLLYATLDRIPLPDGGTSGSAPHSSG